MKHIKHKRIVTLSVTSLILYVLVMCYVTNQCEYSIWLKSHHEQNYITGKDTVLKIQNGKFQIGKFPDTYMLFENINDSVVPLLKDVTKYKIIFHRVYILSAEGYAVIDENDNTGKIFITKLHHSSSDAGYSTPNGVTYLQSFQNFSDSEQKIFIKLCENHWWYGHTFPHRTK